MEFLRILYASFMPALLRFELKVSRSGRAIGLKKNPGGATAVAAGLDAGIEAALERDLHHRTRHEGCPGSGKQTGGRSQCQSYDFRDLGGASSPSAGPADGQPGPRPPADSVDAAGPGGRELPPDRDLCVPRSARLFAAPASGWLAGFSGWPCFFAGQMGTPS